MKVATTENVIIPSNDQTTKIKSKKSKKKNKLAAGSGAVADHQKPKDENDVEPHLLADSMDSEVSADLQNRLRLADAEDSGFGGEVANGYDDHYSCNAGSGIVERSAQPTPAAVRSGPDDDPDRSRASVEEPTDTGESASQQQQQPQTPQPIIEYVSYESEIQMPDIMRLIQKDLSEPYSIYTYRYFIHNWPKLCFLSMHGTKCVGAIVCKLDIHRQNIKRGYIAMLAVDKDYRKLKIGTQLVQNAINAMLAYNADEVVLETEITNIPALRLYENLGFVRDKRLFGYYLNGVDALRLKLWFR